MATSTSNPLLTKGSFNNERKDNWWFSPTLGGLALIIFSIYTFMALFAFDTLLGVDKSYKVITTISSSIGAALPHYVSPLFGLEIPENIRNAIGWPEVLTPALLTIWAPFGFRATCYYARKVYYRSFFGNPPACAVDGVSFRRGKYGGEYLFPFILSNLHRYFFYAAFVLMIIHLIELPSAFLFSVGGVDHFGVGLGSLILLADSLFLTLYVLSCHAFRHLIGGGTECYSCSGIKKVQYKGWKIVSRLNERHGTWFWISITTVLLADFYIRLVSGGLFSGMIFFII